MEKFVLLTFALLATDSRLVLAGQPEQPPAPTPTCIRVMDLQELVRMPCRPSGNGAALFAVDGWSNLLRNATTSGKQIFSAFMVPSDLTTTLFSPQLPVALPPPCAAATTPTYIPAVKKESAPAPVAYPCPEYLTVPEKQPATVAYEPTPAKPTCVRIIDLEDMLRTPCRYSNTDVSLLAVNGWNKMMDGASSFGSKISQAFLVPADYTMNALFDLRNLFSLGKSSLLQQIVKIPTAFRTFATSTFGMLRPNPGNPICGSPVPACQTCVKIPEERPAPVMYACPQAPLQYATPAPVKMTLPPVTEYPKPIKGKEMVDLQLETEGRTQDAKVEDEKIQENKVEDVKAEDVKLEGPRAGEVKLEALSDV